MSTDRFSPDNWPPWVIMLLVLLALIAIALAVWFGLQSLFDRAPAPRARPEFLLAVILKVAVKCLIFGGLLSLFGSKSRSKSAAPAREDAETSAEHSAAPNKKPGANKAVDA